MERRAPVACVLFDLEGTLVDFQWRLAEAEEALRRAAEGLGFSRRLFEGENYAGILHRCLEAAGSGAEREAVRARLAAVYDRYDLDAASRWSLREGAAETLGELDRLGIPAALVTNIGRRAVDRVLGRFGLGGSFAAVVTRDDVRFMKPSGEGIRRALGVLGVPPGHALMVGDSLSDVGAARDAGVAVAVVLGGETPPERLLAARPDHVLHSLQELVPRVVRPGAPPPA